MRSLKLLLCILFFCVVNTTFSQSDFVKGYVILNNSDTLNGFLNQDIENNLSKHVAFSDNENGNPVKEYSSTDIQAFYFNGGNLFESISITDVNGLPAVYFAKYILKGYYNLYSFRRNDVQYFIIKHEDTTYLLYDDIVFPSGTLDTKGNYRNQLLFLSRSCGNLTGQVPQLSYSENVLTGFVHKINDCVAPGNTSSTIGVKTRSKVDFYVYAGGLPLGDKYEYTGRALARISIPSVSKTTFINAGISYMSTKKPEEVYNKKVDFLTNMFNVGLTIQNNFTTGVIQPYIELGIGLSSTKTKDMSKENAQFESHTSADLIAAVGIEGYVTKKLAIKADWRYELMLHYPVIGIAYFF